MAVAADVVPVESRRLVPNRGKFTPFIEVGRGPGGWYWRLRLTHLTTDIVVRWRGAFESRDEAYTAGLVNFNTVCSVIDGPEGKRFKQALDPILDSFRESVEK